MMRRRWDIDERGHGIADGRRFAADVSALAAAVDAPDWIAEEPEAHLLPHLTAAVAASDGRWILDGWRNDAGLLEISVTWRAGCPLGAGGEADGASTGGAPTGVRATLRADAFALLGTVAEAA